MRRRILLAIAIGLPALLQAQDLQQEALKRAARFEKSLTFVIDDDELLPGTMSVPEGQYRLDFRNHFTSSRLDLVLDDDKGKNFGTAELKEKREKEDLIVNLKAGKYVVFVRQRPKWRCVLTVTEKAKN